MPQSGGRAGPVRSTGDSGWLREFDLRGLAKADAEWKRPRRALLLVLMAAFAVGIVNLGGTLLRSGGSAAAAPASDPLDLLWLAAFAGAFAFGALGLRRLRSGARTLRLESAGVHLRYSARSGERIPWTDPRGFVLRDLRDDPSARGDGRALILSRSSVGSRRTLLTPEAFEGLMAEAQRRSLDVTRTSGSARRYGFVPLTYLVRYAPRPRHRS